MGRGLRRVERLGHLRRGGDDHGAQDARHGVALLDILEGQVLPLFTDTDDQGIPRRWIAMVRHSLRTLGPFVSAERMVGD